MSKSVMVDWDLFWLLCRYHLLPEELSEDEEIEVASAIRGGLEAKLDAMQRRQLYTTYRDSRATPQVREAARQAYLDMIGMLPGYRWSGLEPPG